MVCWTTTKQNQTQEQRAEEVREAVRRLSEGLVNNRIKPIVGAQGAVTFLGWNEPERNGVSDACALAAIYGPSGSVLARVELRKAEALAGRMIDRQVVNAGIHSHDGGKTWGSH